MSMHPISLHGAVAPQSPIDPSGYPPLDSTAIVDSGPRRPTTKAPPRLSAADMAAGREKQAARRAEWAALELRQTWSDERWMRAILVTAGIPAPHRQEPATPRRVRLLLRRVGIRDPEIREAVGASVERFLELNTRPLALPLWAAVALICESHGITPGAGWHDGESTP